MTVFEAPVSVISKLYRIVKPTEDSALPSESISKLIVAFCASKISLIDPMPEIKHPEPQIKRKNRYQDQSFNDEKEPEEDQ